VESEHPFRIERTLYFFLGPDESFSTDLGHGLEEMLSRTIAEWRHWVRGLATPHEWQDAVIRAAITLKLCQFEETGAIVAALTTSIPEHAGSQRNWDYRYCWIRDAYYTIQALNRLGALDVLEGYLGYLRNIVDGARGGHIQPLYGLGGEAVLTEGHAPALAGYRGMGPVRVGNQAYEQIQHDAYGQIVLCNTQAFFDRRLYRMADVADFEALQAVGERAFLVHDTPDAGLWELRTRAHVHTYSAAMCWAACDRLANIAAVLGLPRRAEFWQARALKVRETIESGLAARNPAFLGHVRRRRPRRQPDPVARHALPAARRSAFPGHLARGRGGLRRGSHMLRYASEDDFGLPETAFNVCTFWLIEALHATGRASEGRALLEEMLERRTAAGLLSEDIDPVTGELWGNYPQTYSLVGLINCAVLLSKPWSAIR
jgi:GH15 family glucan-1,4-alpha-glucosidase